MKNLDINMLIGTLSTNISKMVMETVAVLDKDFTSDSTDNEQVAKEADLYSAMNQYMIYTILNSQYKKALDKFSERLGNYTNGTPNNSRIISEINNLYFSKKQNKDGTSTLVTDLITALARVGVEKSIVDDAIKQATKVKNES